MTINELIERLYKAIRKSGNYSNEWDLPYFELEYHPAKGWGLFMKRDGRRNTPEELFYKAYSSAEDAFLENIAFYEGRWTPPPEPEVGNFSNRTESEEERAKGLREFMETFGKYVNWRNAGYQ